MAKVRLEEISFNHAGSKPGGSISISRDGRPVMVPEWQNGKVNAKDSLVAYAFMQKKDVITIAVRLSCPDKSLKQVDVEAIADANNVLGNVQRRTVTFNAKGQSEILPFAVPTPRFDDTGVTEVLGSWQWQYFEQAGGAPIPIEKSEHQIYVLVDAPEEPWKREPPWVEVLDFSCDWARGARDDDDAASRITRAVYNLGEGRNKRVYYNRTASYAFNTFDCAGFLKLLLNDIGSPNAINCYDCASIVLTFANILGAKLWEIDMGPEIYTHYIKLIGETRWGRTGFPYHAVSWNSDRGLVFDACLQVDNDGDPNDHCEFTATVPAKLRLEGENSYLFCFFREGLCFPNVEDGLRRPIGKPGFRAQKKVTDRIALALLKYTYRFQTWPEEESGNKFRSNVVTSLVDSLAKLPALHSWLIEDKEIFERDNVFNIRIPLTRDGVSKRNLVDVNLYIVPDTASSNDFFLQLLAQFHKSGLQRESVNTLGRLTFVEPCELGVIFVRRNLAVFVRSVGEKCAVFDLAKALDDFFATDIDGWKEDKFHG